MNSTTSHKIVQQLIRVILICFALQLFHFNTPAQHETRQLNRDQTESRVAEPRRFALVIGNGAYIGISPLRNPPNDSTLVAATLKKLGFNVTVGSNKSQREMKQLIRNFGEALRNAKSVGLFYFAGHGVQSKGRNYLIPIDADIQSEADLEDATVDVNYVLSTMENAQNALNIVILDACRNNPFAQTLRSAQGGLAQIKAPTGTLIAYATAPDRAAADGTGSNSPYTEELVRLLQRPGVLIETTFRRVTEEVSSRTGGKQEPWYSANIKGEFYFTQDPTSEVSTDSSKPETKVVAIDSAASEWERIKESKDKKDLENFVANFPDSVYASVAKQRLQGPATTGKRMQIRVKAFAIDLLSCKASAGDVTCEFTVTNISSTDREFELCTKDFRMTRRGLDVTRATDNTGSQYDVSESVIGSKKTRAGYVSKAVVPPNTPIRMSLVFLNVPETTRQFVLLRVSIYEAVNSATLLPYADFRNIEIGQ